MKNVDLKKIELYEKEIRRYLPTDFIIRDFPEPPVEYLFAQLDCLVWHEAVDMDKKYCGEYDTETHIGMEDRVYQFTGNKIRLVRRSSSDGKLLEVTRLYPCVRTLEEGIALCRVFGLFIDLLTRNNDDGRVFIGPREQGNNMGVFSCP